MSKSRELDLCLASQEGMVWHDSNANALYLKDIVTYTEQMDMFSEDEDERLEGVIIAFPAQDVVMIQPMGGGTAVPRSPSDLLQVRSIIKDIADLADNDELQALLLGAEERYAKALAEKPLKRGGSKGKGKAKAKKIEKPNPFAKLM